MDAKTRELCAALRRLYVQQGTDHVQAAADMIERQDEALHRIAAFVDAVAALHSGDSKAALLECATAIREQLGI